jgi:hypothetical protein
MLEVERVQMPGRAALLLLVIATLSPGRAAAQALDESAYGAWVVAHAESVVAAMQLPNEFRLADLREVADTLGDLVQEARTVGPPARYAAVHGTYLAALDQVEGVREALLTVVLTRAPAPVLGERAFEAGQGLAIALRELRLAGVVLPADLTELFGPDDSSAAAAGTSERACGAPSAGQVVVCDPGAPLGIRVMTRVEVDAANRSAKQPPHIIVALRIRIENQGNDRYLLRRDRVTLEGDGGVRWPLVRVMNVGPELVPPEGLSLGPGESREGALYFARPRTVNARRLWVEAVEGEPVAVPLP